MGKLICVSLFLFLVSVSKDVFPSNCFIEEVDNEETNKREGPEISHPKRKKRKVDYPDHQVSAFPGRGEEHVIPYSPPSRFSFMESVLSQVKEESRHASFQEGAIVRLEDGTVKRITASLNFEVTLGNESASQRIEFSTREETMSEFLRWENDDIALCSYPVNAIFIKKGGEKRDTGERVTSQEKKEYNLFSTTVEKTELDPSFDASGLRSEQRLKVTKVYKRPGDTFYPSISEGFYPVRFEHAGFHHDHDGKESYQKVRISSTYEGKSYAVWESYLLQRNCFEHKKALHREENNFRIYQVYIEPTQAVESSKITTQEKKLRQKRFELTSYEYDDLNLKAYGKYVAEDGEIYESNQEEGYLLETVIVSRHLEGYTSRNAAPFSQSCRITEKYRRPVVSSEADPSYSKEFDAILNLRAQHVRFHHDGEESCSYQIVRLVSPYLGREYTVYENEEIRGRPFQHLSRINAWSDDMSTHVSTAIKRVWIDPAGALDVDNIPDGHKLVYENLRSRETQHHQKVEKWFQGLRDVEYIIPHNSLKYTSSNN